MENTILTIGCVAHNNKSTLKRFIKSTRQIQFKYDLMIWDNASTDGTAEYLESITGDEDFPNLRELRTHVACKQVEVEVGQNFTLAKLLLSDSQYALIFKAKDRITSDINGLIQLMLKNPLYNVLEPIKILSKEAVAKTGLFIPNVDYKTKLKDAGFFIAQEEVMK